MAEERVDLSRDVACAVLRWYDGHARVLPWRVSPQDRAAGVRVDPYRVWLSEIMLQQTTVATVIKRYEAFLARWPLVADLAAAPLDDVLGAWAGLGYYARARNLHKCANAVVDFHGGEFPSDEHVLLGLPGVGAYTAAAIAAIAFDAPSVVVDGNIERIAARFFAIETPLPKAKVEIKNRMGTNWPKRRSGDFAQALMDIGATVCRPRAPQCDECPLKDGCASRRQGRQDELPLKLKKAAKPIRYGASFILRDAQGNVLLERRPEKGLLGGMLGFPGAPWTEEVVDDPTPFAPAKIRWREAGEARHTFTHFHLRLRVLTAQTRRAPKADEIWRSPESVGLPTVMKKALDLALGHSDRLL